MVMSSRANPEEFPNVDPTEEPAIRHYNIRVPATFSFHQPPGELVYDRLADMMLVQFFGRFRDSFVVYVVDDYAVLLDIHTNELVGLQIEDFLFSAVKDQPALITLLDHARLLGMTAAEVRHERQRALGYRGRLKLCLERMWEAVTKRGASHRQDMVEEILNRGQVGSTLRNALGSA